jgi:hypothetical protein
MSQATTLAGLVEKVRGICFTQGYRDSTVIVSPDLEIPDALQHGSFTIAPTGDVDTTITGTSVEYVVDLEVMLLFQPRVEEQAHSMQHDVLPAFENLVLQFVQLEEYSPGNDRKLGAAVIPGQDGQTLILAIRLPVAVCYRKPIA